MFVVAESTEQNKMAANFNTNGSCVFSSVVSIKEFKEQIVSTIGSTDIEGKRAGLDKAKLASEMQISHDTLAELDEVCRLAIIVHNCYIKI